MSTNTDGAIRALRTVAQFATGMASYHHRSPFSRLPGGPRLLRAARRLACAKATGMALSFTRQYAADRSQEVVRGHKGSITSS